MTNAGKVIGACGGPMLNSSMAFIGMYCVHKDYQGLGIGLKLFKKVREHHGDEVNVGLGAVPSQLSTYRDKAGFTVEDDSRMIVFEGETSGIENLTQTVDGVSVLTIDDTIIQSVIEYDASITKFHRESILKLTFSEPQSVAMAAVRAEDNVVLGFGCIKSSNVEKTIIGPLYADDETIAELVFYSLVNTYKPALEHGTIVFALNRAPGALTIPEVMGLKRRVEVPRLYTKAIPDADVSRIYSILTPNFSPF